MGIGPAVGTTHLTIWMANYYASVCQMQVAVLEWNDHRDFAAMGDFSMKSRGRKEFYRLQSVDYFPNGTARILADCMEKKYQMILIDFGRYTTEQLCECARCDKKIVLGALNEWQADGFLGFLKETGRRDKSWRYAVTFGSEETRREAEKMLRLNLLRVPLSVDPFVVTRAHMDFFQGL